MAGHHHKLTPRRPPESREEVQARNAALGTDNLRSGGIRSTRQYQMVRGESTPCGGGYRVIRSHRHDD